MSKKTRPQQDEHSEHKRTRQALLENMRVSSLAITNLAARYLFPHVNLTHDKQDTQGAYNNYSAKKWILPQSPLALYTPKQKAFLEKNRRTLGLRASLLRYPREHLVQHSPLINNLNVQGLSRRISHSNVAVAAISGVIRASDGCYHTAEMYEDAADGDLYKYLKPDYTENKGLSNFLAFDLCLNLFQQVCSATHAFHAAGYSNRDLKLQNALISPYLTPKPLKAYKVTLTDFASFEANPIFSTPYTASPQLFLRILSEDAAFSAKLPPKPSNLGNRAPLRYQNVLYSSSVGDNSRYQANDLWALGVFLLNTILFPDYNGDNEINNLYKQFYAMFVCLVYPKEAPYDMPIPENILFGTFHTKQGALICTLGDAQKHISSSDILKLDQDGFHKLQRASLKKKATIWNGFLTHWISRMFALYTNSVKPGLRPSAAQQEYIQTLLPQLLNFNEAERRKLNLKTVLEELGSVRHQEESESEENTDDTASSSVSTNTNTSTSDPSSSSSASLPSCILTDENNTPLKDANGQNIFINYDEEKKYHLFKPMPGLIDETDEARVERLLSIDYDTSILVTNNAGGVQAKVVTPFWAFDAFREDLKNKIDFYDRLMEVGVLERVSTKNKIKKAQRNDDKSNQFIEHARYAIAYKMIAIYAHIAETYLFMEEEGNAREVEFLQDHARDFAEFTTKAANMMSDLTGIADTMDFNEELTTLVQDAETKVRALMKKDPNTLREFKTEHEITTYVAPVQGPAALDEDSEESAAARIAGATSWHLTLDYMIGQSPLWKKAAIENSPLAVVGKAERKAREGCEEARAAERARDIRARPRRHA